MNSLRTIPRFKQFLPRSNVKHSDSAETVRSSVPSLGDSDVHDYNQVNSSNIDSDNNLKLPPANSLPILDFNSNSQYDTQHNVWWGNTSDSDNGWLSDNSDSCSDSDSYSEASTHSTSDTEWWPSEIIDNNNFNNNQNGWLSSNMSSYSDNENSNNGYISSNNDNINIRWRWPSVHEVIDKITTLQPDDDIRRAWQTILKQETNIPNATADWHPFPNVLWVLLFLGRYDKKLGITRSIINFFIQILKTLKQQGKLDSQYNIPGDGSTLEKLWDQFPELPTGIIFILALGFWHFYTSNLALYLINLQIFVFMLIYSVFWTF